MFATFAVDSCLNGQAADYPYRDHFHTPCPGQPPDAQALLQAFVGAPPAWAQALMRARNRLMAPLGLKTADLPRQAPQAHVGEAVGVFCVWHAGPDELLLGQRDRHLDFCLWLGVRAGRLHLYTGVRPHHLGGWLYLALVWPFHWLIVRRSLARMAAHCSEAAC